MRLLNWKMAVLGRRRDPDRRRRLGGEGLRHRDPRPGLPHAARRGRAPGHPSARRPGRAAGRAARGADPRLLHQHLRRRHQRGAPRHDRRHRPRHAEEGADERRAESSTSGCASSSGQSAGPTRTAQDPVNQPMIRHFVEAMGDENPIYADAEAARRTGRDGVVAPPPMLSTWLMVGYKAHAAAQAGATGGHPAGPAAGHPGRRRLHRRGRHQRRADLPPRAGAGDHLSVSHRHRGRLAAQADRARAPATSSPPCAPTATSTARSWPNSASASCGSIPRAARARPGPTSRSAPRPFILRDNEFWFSAARERRLVIQACDECRQRSATRRRRPAPHCHSFAWHEVEASGGARCTATSSATTRRRPGSRYPHTVLLVDLAEGTRLVADFVGDPAQRRDRHAGASWSGSTTTTTSRCPAGARSRRV